MTEAFKTIRSWLFVVALALLAVCCWQPRSAHAQNSCAASSCVQWGGTGFQSGTTTPGTTVTGVTAGDTLDIYFCGEGPTALGSVTDNGTAVTVGAVQVNAGPGASLCLVAVSSNVTAGSHVIVINTTGSCTSCTTIVPEWAGAIPMVSQNGAANNITGATGPQTGGNVTATGAARLETMYTTGGASSGNPTLPSGFSTAIATVAGVTVAFENVSAGTYKPSWTANAGGDDYPIVMNGVFQSGGTPPLRSLMGVGR
jgi:hypothetical protein